MFRIDGPGSIPAKPARGALSAAGHGWFNQLGPSGGEATRVTAEWLNMLQAELSAVVTAAGKALNKADDAQLLSAIQALITAAIPAAEATKFPVVEKSDNFTVVAADLRTLFVVNAPAGGVAVSPAPVANLGEGFLFGVVNRGTGAVTIDPSGTEKVSGRPGPPTNTFVLQPGESAFFAVDLDTNQIDVVLYCPAPPVTSFNARTGAITLTAADVTGALGYTPWHPNNDGAGSGLDADRLDGQDSGYYTNIPERLGYMPPLPPEFGWGVLITANGGFVTLPAGGTWAWAFFHGNQSRGGISPGGTLLGFGINELPVLAWRIH